MAVLSHNKILSELKKGQDGDGLIITPLQLDQIGSASVDLYLGNEFIVFRRASISSLDILGDSYSNVHRYQEKVRLKKKEPFVLHPHQLVLGATHEYMALPNDLSGEIGGRSTWGRTGLIIATATRIAPNFKGCITLELINEGEIPLVLYPGMCVAQLTLIRTEGDCKFKKGRYQYQTGPEFPDLKPEADKLKFKSIS